MAAAACPSTEPREGCSRGHPGVGASSGGALATGPPGCPGERQGRILGQQPRAEGRQQQSSFPGAGCCPETRERRDELEMRGSSRRNLKTQRRFCASCWSSFLSRCRFLFLARTEKTGSTVLSWGQFHPSPSFWVSAAWLGEQGSAPAAGASPCWPRCQARAHPAATLPSCRRDRGAGAGTPCSGHGGTPGAPSPPGRASSG